MTLPPPVRASAPGDVDQLCFLLRRAGFYAERAEHKLRRDRARDVAAIDRFIAEITATVSKVARTWAAVREASPPDP